MPNYSPARKVFSSIKKDIKEVPFDECFKSFLAAKSEISADLQADIDAEYEEEIRQKEQEYSDTHEAPYEGNFSDSITKRKVVIDAATLSRYTTERIKVDFIDKYGIPLHIDWILEQAVTIIGKMPVKRFEDNLIDGHAFKYENFTTDWLRGLHTFLMINSKSKYLKLQYTAPHKQYGAIVPFIMYAVRCVQGIKYSEWDPETIHHVVHSELADAMVYDPPEYSKEQLLEFRVKGLTVKSGAAEGSLKAATRTSRLNTIGDPEWDSVPTLVQVMLTQIWMAHPENRTTYMILDPVKWDRMPASLIPREVVQPPTRPVPTRRKETAIEPIW